MNMTICRKCGTSNQDGKKFCVFCNELLIADPEEMAKREAVERKRLEKQRKRLEAKHKRWKRALFLLIPIGVLDLLDLILCLDLAFVGIGSRLGNLLGSVLANFTGSIVTLFGNDVYTDQLVEYAFRGCELFGAFFLLLAAIVLSVIMIVQMIKWRIYRTKGDKQERAWEMAERKMQEASDAPGESAPVEESAARAIKAAMGELRVSYAMLSQLEEQKETYEMPAPVRETDCKSLYEALAPQLWEYDEDSVRRILGAMAASRFLVCSAGAIDSASIFDNLSGAFGVRAEQYDCPAVEGEDADAGMARVLLQREPESGILTHSSFTKALYTAGFFPKNICFAGVGGVSAAQTESVFAPMRAYFGLPESNVALFVGEPDAESAVLPAGAEEGNVVLSSNLWVLSVLPEQDRAPGVGKVMGEYCAAIYLRNSGKAFTPEAVGMTLPSVEAWTRAVAAAENEYYLPEELWHVIDRIEQQVMEMGGARLSNRTLRMLERYTAVYLAAGGKQSDAFDNGFAAILIPAYAEQMRLISKRENGETLSAILERMVGRERLPVTLEVLALMGLA